MGQRWGALLDDGSTARYHRAKAEVRELSTTVFLYDARLVMRPDYSCRRCDTHGRLRQLPLTGAAHPLPEEGDLDSGKQVNNSASVSNPLSLAVLIALCSPRVLRARQAEATREDRVAQGGSVLFWSGW